jgi:hypothetical protein
MAKLAICHGQKKVKLRLNHAKSPYMSRRVAVAFHADSVGEVGRRRRRNSPSFSACESQATPYLYSIQRRERRE